MGKFEKEVKILDIDKKMIEKKLVELGAQKKEESMQQIYVYDLPSIYARFYDCLLQLKKSIKPYEFEVCRNKLEGILREVDNLTGTKEQEILEQEGYNKTLSNLLRSTSNSELLTTLSSKCIVDIVKEYGINPNKWVRLRKSGDKTTLTVKHILKPSNESNKIQNVIETEMEVPSIEEANDMLNQLGFSFRNYQEKHRVRYNFEDLEIDIDSWPLIPTYMEIECESEDHIDSIVKKLELENKKVVSCNTADVYKLYGIDLYQFRELKFPQKEEIR